MQIGRRREASPSMSDFRQDRKSANPLFDKMFRLWHGRCRGLRIKETSSMIMRTENAVAAVKTALSPAIKPPKARVMVEAGDCAGFKHLNGPGKRLARRRRGHPDGRKGHTSLPHVAGMTRRLSPRWNARVYIRRTERAGQSSQIRSAPGLENVREGAQWLWPIFAANKPPSGKTL